MKKKIKVSNIKFNNGLLNESKNSKVKSDVVLDFEQYTRMNKNEIADFVRVVLEDISKEKVKGFSLLVKQRQK